MCDYFCCILELSHKRKKVLTYWLATGAIMVFMMVAIGGITRLTHSGLSMTDWHLVWFGGKCQKTNGILMINGLKPKSILLSKPLNYS